MNTKIRWPIKGERRITFRYGEAPDWYTRIFGYPHNGIDLGCKEGTSVLAVDDGIVSFADSVPDQNGEGIIILHEWGSSLYWHLSKVIAREGAKVTRGSEIGLSGQTGYCTGPHLHFGVKVTSEKMETMKGWSDPLLYLEETSGAEEHEIVNPVVYLIKPGDTLWGIAEKFYGNGTEWRRIWEANKESIPNPNIIRPWKKIKIV